MCLTCGCGEPHKDMGDENITYDDIKRAADANGMTVSETAFVAAIPPNRLLNLSTCSAGAVTPSPGPGAPGG